MLPSQFLNVVLEEKDEQVDDEIFGASWEAGPEKNENALEGLDLTGKLPKAFLSECTVEIRRQPERKETPKLRFEARVTPIYNSDDSGPTPGVSKKEEADITKVEDLLSEVEAVYSEHESDSELETSCAESKARVPGETYRCEHCPNVYTNRGALWQHSVASHSLSKNCECSICGRKFYRNCSLALHLKSHAAEEEGHAACEECGREFSKASTLERHIRCSHAIPALQNAHAVPGLAVSCPSCSRVFKTVERLETHIKSTHPTVTPSRPAEAPAVQVLPAPSITPTAPRPFQCQFCKKCYSQKSVLKKHLVIHTGERLTCSLCGIDFTQKSSLLRHVKRMHSTVPVADTKSLFVHNVRIPQGISISMID